jgi:surfactin synthase thioesterase subunit
MRVLPSPGAVRVPRAAWPRHGLGDPLLINAIEVTRMSDAVQVAPPDLGQIRNDRGRLRVVCLPPAGAGSDFFGPLAEDLRGSHVTLTLVELPGHGRRRGEPAFRRMSDLVDELVSALLPLGECVLLGHSMGALVAFEAARRLQDLGQPPLAVVASGGLPPHAGAAAGRAAAAGTALPSPSSSDDELLARLVQWGALPAGSERNHHLGSLLLPMLRTDLRLVTDYLSREHQAAAVLHGPLLALSAADDDTAPPQVVGTWSRWTRSAFVHVVRPGRHSFLTQDRPRTARALVRGLDLLDLAPAA